MGWELLNTHGHHLVFFSFCIWFCLAFLRYLDVKDGCCVLSGAIAYFVSRLGGERARVHMNMHYYLPLLLALCAYVSNDIRGDYFFVSSS